MGYFLLPSYVLCSVLLLALGLVPGLSWGAHLSVHSPRDLGPSPGFADACSADVRAPAPPSPATALKGLPPRSLVPPIYFCQNHKYLPLLVPTCYLPALFLQSPNLALCPHHVHHSPPRIGPASEPGAPEGSPCSQEHPHTVCPPPSPPAPELSPLNINRIGYRKVIIPVCLHGLRTSLRLGGRLSSGSAQALHVPPP